MERQPKCTLLRVGGEGYLLPLSLAHAVQIEAVHTAAARRLGDPIRGIITAALNGKEPTPEQAARLAARARLAGRIYDGLPQDLKESAEAIAAERLKRL